MNIVKPRVNIYIYMYILCIFYLQFYFKKYIYMCPDIFLHIDIKRG